MAHRFFSALPWIKRLLDVVRHGRARRIYLPSSVVSIKAVGSGQLLCGWRGNEALSRVGKRSCRLRIGNDLHTHPAGAVVNEQAFWMLAVEGINHLTVRPQCFNAYKAPRPQ